MSERLIDQDSHHHRALAHSSDSLIQEFETHLKARGHRDGTLHAYLESARHFLRWLDEQPATQRRVVAETVRNFLQVHLPVCDCPQPVTRNLKTVRASLNQLLLMQGNDRLRLFGSRATDNIEASITQFDRYMKEHALAALQPPKMASMRFKPPIKVLAFLDTL